MAHDIVSASQESPARPRTIITADPELDDLNSMLRLLLYSNELAIEGLVYASSRYHWKGDGSSEFFIPEREYTTPRTSWRWAPGERFIDDAIDAYELVHPNLVIHDPRYPHPEQLRACVREGNVQFEGDMLHETPGSLLITDALLDERPGPLHLQVWAGTSTIARALASIEDRYSQSNEWSTIKAAVSRKAIITKFASQDGTYDSYIRPNWPDIRVVDVATKSWGYFARSVVRPADAHLLSAEWMRDNVTSVGPLGALYRTWGTGSQMVEGDPTDYFHLSGHTSDELRDLGYRVWMPPQQKGEWISEGDTTNMLNLIGNGLRGHENPGYGGWGGRAVPPSDDQNSWSVAGAVDVAPDGTEPPEYSVSRWFTDAQLDFAARLKWTVTAAFEDANHHPVLTVSPGLDLIAAPGSSVELSATTSDPDGDVVECHWWHYREAGSYTGDVQLTRMGESVVVVVPSDCENGQTIHIIAEARDNGSPSLVSYRRVIITVEAADVKR